MLVTTTTRVKTATTAEQRREAAVAALRRLNELPPTLRVRNLREHLAKASLRDALVRDNDSDLASPDPIDAALATQSVLFSLPTPTRGDIAPTEAPSESKREAQRPAPAPAVNLPAMQAKVEGGAPPSDPEDHQLDDATVFRERHDDLEASAQEAPRAGKGQLDQLNEGELPASVGFREATELEEQEDHNSRAFSDTYESLFPLQRRAGAGLSVPRVPQLPNLRSGGRELPDDVRRKMEAAFGVDFRSVRVLVGNEAPAIGAIAFARGEQIYFAPGRFDPLSRAGQELLGHELAHVVQQRAGRVRPDTGSFLNTSAALEAEADTAGAAAARGQRAVVQGATSSVGMGAAIQRDTGDSELGTSTQDGNISGTLTEGEGGKDAVNGTIALKEATLAGGIRLTDVSGTGKLDGDRITEFEGSATLIFPIDGVDTFQISCTNLVIKPGGTIESGEGPLSTLREIELAKARGYRLSLAKGASATGKLADNRVDSISGDVEVVLSDDEGALLGIALKGSVDPHKARFDGTATVTAKRRMVVLDDFGPDNAWLISLAAGASATATFDNNVLTKIGPQLALTLEDAKGPMAELVLRGEVEFNKNAKRKRPDLNIESATLTGKRDFFVYRLAPQGWDVYVKSGATATVELTDGKPSGFTGTIPLSVRDVAGELFTLSLDGKSDTQGVIDGTATMALARNLPLPIGGEGSTAGFTLKTGTTATLTLTKGKATRIEGGVKGSYTDTLGEQPLVIDVEGTADIDLPTKTLTAASGTAKLASALTFPDQHLRLDSLSGTATFAKGALTQVDGSMGTTLFDEAGDLIGLKASGTWKPGNKVSGTGTATLLRDLDYVLSESTQTKVTLLKDTAANAVFTDGELSAVDGKLKGQLSVGGTPRAGLELTGKYDLKKKVLESGTGTATLLAPIPLLDGKATITGATLTAELAEGKLKKIGGDVSLTAPDLKVDKATLGFTWRNEGGEDLYTVNGNVDWTFFDEGDRKLSGTLAVDYKEDKSFTAEARAAYQLNKYISGGGTVKVDEKVEPEVIEGWLKYSQTLVEPRDLFRLNMNLFDLTIPVGIPGVNIELGMSIGTGLALDELPVAGEVKLTEAWKLKADDEKSRVPAFETTISPKWGATFDAYAGAFLGLALGAPLAKVSLGAKGKVILAVTLSTAPELTLGGGGDRGFYGNLNVGAKVTPKLTLKVVPYTKATLGTFYTGEKEFEGFEQPLHDFAGLDWSMEYAFGDQGTSAKKGAPAQGITASGSQENTQVAKAEADTKTASTDSTDTSTPSLQGDAVANEQESKAKTGQAGAKESSRSKLDLIVAIVKGLGALENLLSLIGGAIKSFLIAGPIGFGAYLAWKAFKGELSWEKLTAQVAAVQEALSAVRELLADKLNPKVSALLGVLSGEMTIKEALFGNNKGKMVKEVEDGMHRQYLPEVRGDMVNVLIDGFCTGVNEDAAMEILSYSAVNGDLRTVMLTVAGGPDAIISAFDGNNAKQVKKLFQANGIPFREGLGRIFGVGGDSGAKLASDELADITKLDEMTAKVRAGMVSSLAEGKGDPGHIMQVVFHAKAAGDLDAVIEQVRGGVAAVRKGVPENQRRALNRLLFAGGVHDIDGLIVANIATYDVADLMSRDARVGALTKLMSVWYMNEAEENSVVALLSAAGNPRSELADAGSTPVKAHDRVSGGNKQKVASLFGGVQNLKSTRTSTDVPTRATTGASGAPSPSDGGGSAPTAQAKADDQLTDGLSGVSQRKSGAPAPKTAAVQRLAEHFDAVKDE